MCGPSNQEEQLQSGSESLSNTLASNYNTYFGDQSAVLGRLQGILTPIAEAGPDQQGFGANELASLNTSVGEGVGANYAKASQALNNTLAARGGGNEQLPTGARAALKGSLASAAANQLSTEQSQITQANYAQGRNNWSQATAGLNALAQDYNPNAIAGSAIGANQNAFGEASAINQQKNQKWADIASGIEGLAGGAMKFASGSDMLGQIGGGKIFGPGGIFG